VPVLVLGAGYIGAALIQRLCAEGAQVVAVDNWFATDEAQVQALADRFADLLDLRRCDIRDAHTLEHAFAAAEPIETVYLIAAQASAHADAATPEYTEETNLRGPRLVLEAARHHGSPPVVYASSFHVYGTPLSGTVDEQRPYGAFRDLQHLSKVYAEKLGELYAREHGVPFAPVRLGITYGAGPVMKRNLRFVTVPHAFSIFALRGERFQVHASGALPLGFIHLDDAVAALLAAPAPGYAPANAVGEVLSAVDVAQAVQAAASARGHNPEIALPSDYTPRDPFTVRSRLSAAGWRPQHTLAAVISELLDYYAQ